MVYGIFIVIHILVAAMLVAVVLMQTGRGGGLAGAFGGGGGGGQSLFGGRGATTFLTKTTWVLGVAFMVISFTLAMMVSKRGASVPEERSLLRDNPPEAPASTLPMEPTRTESPGFEIPSGEDTPGTTGETPVVPSDAEGVPSGGEPPAESTDEVPSSGGN